jgi:ABC-type nitrate/sulfonate/bicarbonate transport system substrate-binding protein
MKRNSSLAIFSTMALGMVLVTLPTASTAQAATAKAGQACKPAGKVSGGLTCTKKGSKLVYAATPTTVSPTTPPPAATPAATTAASTVPAGAPASAAALSSSAGDLCAKIDLSKAPANPVLMRLGHGTASEENYWYQFVDPAAAGAVYNGSWYTIKNQAFNPTDRLDAYQAGALDGGTLSAPAVVSAVGAGLKLRAVATIAAESKDPRFFNSKFMALTSSNLTKPSQLKGKSIGILATNTSTHYWAQSAVASGGLDPDKDVKYVVIPFPEQEAALRKGTIDVGVFVEPFYSNAQRVGGLTEVFDSITGPKVEQELLLAWFDQGFIEKNPGAFCAWRSDFLSATRSYIRDRERAGAILIKAGLVRSPNAAAFALQSDYARRFYGEIDLAKLNAVIDDAVKIGFFKKAQVVPANKLILPGYSIVK